MPQRAWDERPNERMEAVVRRQSVAPACSRGDHGRARPDPSARRSAHSSGFVHPQAARAQPAVSKVAAASNQRYHASRSAWREPAQAGVAAVAELTQSCPISFTGRPSVPVPESTCSAWTLLERRLDQQQLKGPLGGGRDPCGAAAAAGGGGAAAVTPRAARAAGGWQRRSRWQRQR